MAKEVPAPRKRRTRQHVIAAQSVNHVERFIFAEGHTAERTLSDYGYDLVLFTFDEQGYAEEGSVYLQLKASEELEKSGNDFVFSIDRRDYNHWTAEPMPVVLVLFSAARKRAYWVYLQRHFAGNTKRLPRPNARTVRVRIPEGQVINRSAIRKMRKFKQAVLKQIQGAIDHE